MPTLSSTLPTAPTAPTITAKQHSLSLLSEYAHSLDALPLDLSRIFADLRELDAVLTSTVASITAKIQRLIDMIEHKGTATNEQRLWLLGEIAEDAGKVRPGAEDKIRIATQAADTLQVQASHLTLLLRHLPEYDAAAMTRRTVYPHVSSKPYAVPPFEGGRRRRVAAGGGLLLGSGDGSPNKRRRIIQEEDMEYGTGKTPRRDKPGDGTSGARGPRGGGRVKKVERMPSPSESLLSIASPMPGTSSAAGLQRSNIANGHRHNANNANANNNASSNNPGSSSKRRGGNASNSQAPQIENNASLLDSVLSRKEQHHLPPSSSTAHPSLMDPERAGHDAPDRKGSSTSASHSHHNAHTSGNINGSKGASSHHPEWAGSSGGGQHHHQNQHNSHNQRQGDGHGPSASTGGGRASTHSSLTTNAGPASTALAGSPAPNGGGALAAPSPTTVADDGGEGDGEDGQTYCVCNGVSYGEMIACDDEGCVREWFHLACMGLTTIPDGKWFCDECTTKRANRRPSRGGKKKGGGGGGRVGGRSGANGS